MIQRKYQRPEFLVNLLSQSQDGYEEWLQRKAKSLVERDRKWLQSHNKNSKKVILEAYKVAIHKAVCECQGRDAYTGEVLDWDLLGKWDNEQAKQFKREYKKQFALLPTVDHIDELGVANFKICAWRTNDVKNDLSLNELIKFCKLIIRENK
jgi:hypothetical protein